LEFGQADSNIPAAKFYYGVSIAESLSSSVVSPCVKLVLGFGSGWAVVNGPSGHPPATLSRKGRGDEAWR